jgi:UDP:flavonoid glycosyltransferase YjiC (YdhE family)
VRVLFTSTQGAGHYQPLVPFIEGCLRLAHDVHVVVPPELDETLAASGYPYTLGADPAPEELGAIWGSVRNVPVEEARRIVLGELFGRLKTAGMLPAVRGVAASWHPQLIVREAQEYAGAVVAEEIGRPHVRVAVSLAQLEAVSLREAAPALEGFRPGLDERIAASPYLSSFPASLDPAPFDPVTRVRDSTVGPPAEALPDWWEDRDAPLVYVTFGTVLGGMAEASASFGVVVEALAELPVRVLLTTGRAIDPAALGTLPPSVHAERWIPQASVLGHAAVVVCHGGSGTTLGALGAGVPLVIVPLFADQRSNAAAVESAGAGIAVEPIGAAATATIRVLTREDDEERIWDAVATVLADPSYREAAARIAEAQRAVASVDSVLEELTRS